MERLLTIYTAAVKVAILTCAVVLGACLEPPPDTVAHVRAVLVDQTAECDVAPGHQMDVTVRTQPPAVDELPGMRCALVAGAVDCFQYLQDDTRLTFVADFPEEVLSIRAGLCWLTYDMWRVTWR